jgi:hypothetical protein
MGSFSYAEIVKDFNIIFGVTGTLKTISADKKLIMKKDYNLDRFSYIPSVFGENQRKFCKEADFLVETQDDFFMVLSNNIKEKL